MEIQLTVSIFTNKYNFVANKLAKWKKKQTILYCLFTIYRHASQISLPACEICKWYLNIL